MLTLADELKYTGVTANLLWVKTIDEKHAWDKSPSSEVAFWTTLEETWASIGYLCSEEAAALNGARLPFYGCV